MAIRFRFRPIPFVATVLLVALGVSLGRWQDGRAAEKTARQEKLAEFSAAAPLTIAGQTVEAQHVDARMVSVTGQFVSGFPVLLDNRPMDRKAGYYVIMPFKIAGSDMHVLVARGWIPRRAAVSPANASSSSVAKAELAQVMTPSGTVTVSGVAKLHLPRVMKMGEPAPIQPGAVLQNLEIDEFAKATSMSLQPFIIEQTKPAAEGDTMVRTWPAADLGVDKHKGYAFQWYALALMALLFFVITGFKREPN